MSDQPRDPKFDGPQKPDMWVDEIGQFAMPESGTFMPYDEAIKMREEMKEREAKIIASIDYSKGYPVFTDLYPPAAGFHIDPKDFMSILLETKAGDTPIWLTKEDIDAAREEAARRVEIANGFRKVQGITPVESGPPKSRKQRREEQQRAGTLNAKVIVLVQGFFYRVGKYAGPEEHKREFRRDLLNELNNEYKAWLKRHDKLYNYEAVADLFMGKIKEMVETLSNRK